MVHFTSPYCNRKKIACYREAQTIPEICLYEKLPPIASLPSVFSIASQLCYYWDENGNGSSPNWMLKSTFVDSFVMLLFKVLTPYFFVFCY